MTAKPVLTIGMIVKNEIRCLERCLKALQPLRNAVPCELIIADTGSDDGTREVAEKYADLVFDFPWINDFAAARNSVIDKAKGEWYLSVDADEYLDVDCTEIIQYLQNPSSWQHSFCGVIIRNYASEDLTGSYSDFLAVRMARMSTGARYQGAIHEMWTCSEGAQIYGQRKTVFHHDGYVGLSSEQGAAKRKRNMDLLREHLEVVPGELKTLMQCIDSCEADERLIYVRKALEGVREKRAGWNQMGPVIFRSAVYVAHDHSIPEYEEWVHEAEQLFPQSLYVTICINRLALMSASGKKDYHEVIRRGEIYLKSMEDYNAGRFEPWELAVSALDANQMQEDNIRIIMADAYFHEKCYQNAHDVLLAVNGGRLDAGQVANCMSTLLNLHAQSEIDMSQYMANFWIQINVETPKKDWVALRRNAVYFRATRAYSLEFRQEEDKIGVIRHAYTLFSGLEKQCELGIATTILNTKDPAKLKNEINSVENWERLPIEALAYAIEHSVEFPTCEKTLEIEVLDGLAGKMAQNQAMLHGVLEQVLSEKNTGTWQHILWTRALALAAVQKCQWNDAEQNMFLARTFSEVECRFINQYYAKDLLQEKNLCALPPLHRFGWYCAQAFAKLDAGNPTGYTYLLRKGLAACKSMKPMVEFLIKNTLELHIPEPDPELMDLAGKVHDLLNLYPQDDPAVIAIKQSAVYQRVAHLIEEDTL